MPHEEHQKEGLFFDCLAFDGKKNGKKASFSKGAFYTDETAHRI
jgi:hypothetical protein